MQPWRISHWIGVEYGLSLATMRLKAALLLRLCRGKP
jgi:hypothetical protein